MNLSFLVGLLVMGADALSYSAVALFPLTWNVSKMKSAKTVLEESKDVEFELEEKMRTMQPSEDLDKVSMHETYENELNVLKNKVAGLENMLRSVSGLRLTKKKRLILGEAGKISGKTTFTSAVDTISRNLSIPYSTVKWNMMRLRSSGLIKAGNKERQSVPMLVTEAGKTAINIANE